MEQEDILNFKQDDRPALGGYAPGGYICRCHSCLSRFLGDKRSIVCADCAYTVFKQMRNGTSLKLASNYIDLMSDYNDQLEWLGRIKDDLEMAKEEFSAHMGSYLATSELEELADIIVNMDYFSGKNDTISSFSGDYSFLSNFHPCLIEFEGDTYLSVEHAYQAAKTEDLTLRDKIRHTPSASAAKRLGRTVPLRKGWDLIKDGIMFKLLLKKFVKGSPLAFDLMATEYKRLVEGNDWGDTYWGVCKGEGENKLGFMLEAVRAYLFIDSNNKE